MRVCPTAVLYSGWKISKHTCLGYQMRIEADARYYWNKLEGQIEMAAFHSWEITRAENISHRRRILLIGDAIIMRATESGAFQQG